MRKLRKFLLAPLWHRFTAYRRLDLRALRLRNSTVAMVVSMIGAHAMSNSSRRSRPTPDMETT